MTEVPPAAYLDANVFILGVEGDRATSEPIVSLLNKTRLANRTIITSELTLAEVLVGPERRADLALKRIFLELLAAPTIHMPPISRALLMESVTLMGVHIPKLKLPDAIHLATAMAHGCRVFITGDRGINPPQGMIRVAPDVEGIRSVLEMLA